MCYRGWTDEEGNEFAIACCSDGTSFVDVTNPDEPVVLGFLPGTPGTLPSNWRDVKVYKHYAYIGSEARDHGLQVFDMSQLTATAKNYRMKKAALHPPAPRNVASDGHITLGNTFNSTTIYGEFGKSTYELFLECMYFIVSGRCASVVGTYPVVCLLCGVKIPPQDHRTILSSTKRADSFTQSERRHVLVACTLLI